MKTAILIVLFTGISSKVWAQPIWKEDSLIYVYYHDRLGKQRKAVVATPPQILIVSGDSTYTLLNEIQFKKHVESKKDRGINIINHPDSINLFIRKRIKAIVVLEEKNK